MKVPAGITSRSLVAFITLMAVVSLGVFAVVETERRAIVSVRVAGELRHTPRADLERAVAAHTNSSLYRVDVGRIRAAAMAQAWVKHASVRRVWPDSLHIAVIEREPVARWQSNGFIEADASVFFPPSLEGFEDLPQLDGPPGTETEVLDRFMSLRSLLGSVSRQVARITLDERHAWLVELDSGVEIVIGQARDNHSVERLVAVFHGVLRTTPSPLERVDLRYTNGFAVRWKGKTQTQPGEEQG